MNLKTQRNIFVVTSVVLLAALLAVVFTPLGSSLTGAAGGQGKGKGKGTTTDANGNKVVTSEEDQAVDPATPGSSVVGPDAFINGLNIHTSGGNDVVFIIENNDPAAYGANKDGVLNLLNACSIPGGGFADVGSPDYVKSDGTAYPYHWRSKLHEYVFTFTQGTVGNFKIGVVDYSDFLPNGACPNGECQLVMTAYNEGGEVVDTDTLTLQTTDSGLFRNVVVAETGESGNTETIGDACEAASGQPGKYVLQVSGPAISEVHLNFVNAESTDPHLALWAGPLEFSTPEGTGTQGYWKNHQGEWPVDELVLGDTTYTAAELATIYDTSPEGDNTIQMAHQLITAKFNVLAGNDNSCIQAEIDAADAWLIEVGGVGSGASWTGDANAIHDKLDDYNNGRLDCADHRG